MAKFSLIREAAFDIYKETRLLRKWIEVITESIQINKSRAPSEVFCGGLEFGSLSDPSHQCLWNDTVRRKEKISKIHDFVA